MSARMKSIDVVKKSPLPYPYIRAWGSMMRSFPHYISSQIAIAKQQDAERDVIYRDGDPNGGWHYIYHVGSISTVIEMVHVWLPMFGEIIRVTYDDDYVIDASEGGATIVKPG